MQKRHSCRVEAGHPSRLKPERCCRFSSLTDNLDALYSGCPTGELEMPGKAPRLTAVSRLFLQSLLLSTALSTAAMAQETAGGIETVTVTAQKRSEDVQKVPVSIQVLPGKVFEEFHQTDLH